MPCMSKDSPTFLIPCVWLFLIPRLSRSPSQGSQWDEYSLQCQWILAQAGRLFFPEWECQRVSLSSVWGTFKWKEVVLSLARGKAPLATSQDLCCFCWWLWWFLCVCGVFLCVCFYFFLIVSRLPCCSFRQQHEEILLGASFRQQAGITLWLTQQPLSAHCWHRHSPKASLDSDLRSASLPLPRATSLRRQSGWEWESPVTPLPFRPSPLNKTWSDKGLLIVFLPWNIWTFSAIMLAYVTSSEPFVKAAPENDLQCR